MRTAVPIVIAALLGSAAPAIAQNQPLYIIDGIVIVGPIEPRVDILGDVITADEIEGIEVIRGAAATARYGEVARFGVLLVRTSNAPDSTPAARIARARALVDALNRGYTPPPRRTDIFIDPPPTAEDLRTPIFVVDETVQRRGAMSDSVVNRLVIESIEVITRETAVRMYGRLYAGAGVIVVRTRPRESAAPAVRTGPDESAAYGVPARPRMSLSHGRRE